jgi:hypothetical protein
VPTGHTTKLRRVFKSAFRFSFNIIHIPGISIFFGEIAGKSKMFFEKIIFKRELFKQLLDNLTRRCYLCKK